MRCFAFSVRRDGRNPGFAVKRPIVTPALPKGNSKKQATQRHPHLKMPKQKTPLSLDNPPLMSS
jgi:hypothetical protein